MRDEKVGCVYKPHLTVFLWSSSQLPLCPRIANMLDWDSKQGLKDCFLSTWIWNGSRACEKVESPSFFNAIWPINPHFRIFKFCISAWPPFWNRSLVPCKLWINLTILGQPLSRPQAGRIEAFQRIQARLQCLWNELRLSLSYGTTTCIDPFLWNGRSGLILSLL